MCAKQKVLAKATTTRTTTKLNTMTAWIKNDTPNWIYKYLLKTLQIVWKCKFVNKALLQRANNKNNNNNSKYSDKTMTVKGTNNQYTVKQDVKFVSKKKKKDGQKMQKQKKNKNNNTHTHRYIEYTGRQYHIDRHYVVRWWPQLHFDNIRTFDSDDNNDNNNFA